MEELPPWSGGPVGGPSGGGLPFEHDVWHGIFEALGKLEPGIDHVMSKLGHAVTHGHVNPSVGGPLNPLAFGGGVGPAAVHHAWMVHLPLVNPHVLIAVTAAKLLQAIADADARTRERARTDPAFALELAKKAAERMDFMMYGKWSTGERQF